MKKSFSYLSFITAITLLSGCGGSSSTATDTIAPSLSSSKYIYENVAESNDISIQLISDDASAQFVETSNLARIDGDKLIFTAPAFMTGSSNSYKIEVVAKDNVGNESSPKEFTFNVIEVNAGTYAADASIVA